MPHIKLESPNGGESWQIGSNQNISFSTNYWQESIGNYYNIQLWKSDGTLVGDIESNIELNSSTYNWEVGFESNSSISYDIAYYDDEFEQI